MREVCVKPDTELIYFFFPPGWLELGKKSMEAAHLVP